LGRGAIRTILSRAGSGLGRVRSASRGDIGFGANGDVGVVARVHTGGYCTVSAKTRRVPSTLRKNSDFDLVLKGRGFSRAVSVAKSIPAFSRRGLHCVQSDFFRSLLGQLHSGGTGLIIAAGGH
jgi:hypothetical protein